MNMRVTDLPAATRVELLDIDDMPHDRFAYRAARDKLDARQQGVWMRLRVHLWEYGSLPAGSPALAKIAGIGVASFERAMPKLDGHFDRTPQGAWTDDVLMRARGTRLVLPSPEVPAVDPGLREKRSAAGRAGGLASGESRRESAASQQASVPAEARAGHLLQAEAKAEAKPEANEPSKDGGFASDLVSRRLSWFGFEDSDSEETNQPTAHASEAKPSAGDEANEPTPPEAKPTEAKADDRFDRQMAKAIVDACPGKIEWETALWSTKKIKQWKGCNFERDYLPVLKTFAATNSKVTSPANPDIEAAVFLARDRRLGCDAARPARPDLARASPETRALHKRFEELVGTAAYFAWGTRIAVLEIKDDVARLGVPTRLIKDSLEGKHERQLVAAARHVAAGVARVEIEVRPAT